MASRRATHALTISIEENHLFLVDRVNGNVSRHSLVAKSPTDIERGGLFRINVGNLLAGLQSVQLGGLWRSESLRCSHVEIVAAASPNQGEIRR